MALSLALSACGGGNSSSNNPATAATGVAISGDTSAPSAVLVSVAAQDVPFYGTATTAKDMLLPTSSTGSFATIAQSATYTIGGSSTKLVFTGASYATVLPATNLVIKTGSSTYAGDASLGVWTYALPDFNPRISASLIAPAGETVAGLPAAAYPSSNITDSSVVVTLPKSSAISPSGYVYQSMGYVVMQPNNSPVTESWFSVGIPTTGASLPTSGMGTYSGVLTGTYVNASTGDPAELNAKVDITVNFATKTVTLASSNTTTLSANAPSNAAPSANTLLNLSGNLSYVSGGNTIVGAITSQQGLSGNAVIRFYGAGIGSATSSKVLGSAPEVGGTFAVMLPGVGAVQGVFAAQ